MRNRSVVAVASMVFLATLGVATPSDSPFYPQVHAGEVLTYRSSEYVSAPIDEANDSTVTFKIESTADSAIRFSRTLNGKTAEYSRSASGALVQQNGPAPLFLAFFLPSQILGTPPTPIVKGAAWDATVPEQSLLGPPGIAHLRVTNVDPADGKITLDLRMSSHGDSIGTPPGNTAPVRFHTDSVRDATVVLRDGVLQSFTMTGQDRQTADGARPLSVQLRSSFILHP